MYYSFKKTSIREVEVCLSAIYVSGVVFLAPTQNFLCICQQVPIYVYTDIDIHTHRVTTFFFVLIRIFMYSFFYQTVNVIKPKSLLTKFGSIIFILVSLMILVVNFGKCEF